MSNAFVDKSKEQMGAIERLLKGLPVIKGYVDKELRRDADYRLRQMIAEELNAQKQRLLSVQQKLARSGGLRYVDDVDAAVQKLQTLVDRIRTASYGYAGLFDAARIREEQLDALHQFDVALAKRTYEVREAIDQLETAIAESGDLSDAIYGLMDKFTELNRLYDERRRAVEDPELLTTESAPPVDEDWMDAADQHATEEPSASGES